MFFIGKYPFSKPCISSKPNDQKPILFDGGARNGVLLANSNMGFILFRLQSTLTMVKLNKKKSVKNN